MSQDRLIKIACSDCGHTLYSERRKKGDNIQKLEIKKYCSKCKKHKLFKEKKK